MNIVEFEKLILYEINNVVLSIINDFPILNISAKARAGAEISDFLENKFVEYTVKHKYFMGSEGSPKGATKNPYDVKTYFIYNNINELIWIDFKALKTSGQNSNPDIGTPNKIIELINSGYFYLAYVYVYYEEYEDGLRFVKVNEEVIKSYFLKDIHHSFRRNPKNQLQVNMSEPPEYRTREDFIKLLITKLKESHERQISISTKALIKLPQAEDSLININKESESKLLNNLK